MKYSPRFALPLALAVLLVASAPSLIFAQEDGEAGHLHGPDGRHVAVAATFGGQAAGQKSILSHHDVRVTLADQSNAEGEGNPVQGCDIHSVIHKKGDPNAVIHREHNSYEVENGVYGSHMMYREPGEYVIVEKVTLPDKQEITVEFPIWVPDPNSGAAQKGQAEGVPPWLLALGGGITVAAVAGAFYFGRRSGRRSVAALTLMAFAATSVAPMAVRAQEEGGEEAGHLHGPDGRHIAVASTFGPNSGREPLRAYPSPEKKEFAVQTVGKYRFRLSIENEEMAPPDPDVIPVSPAVAKTIDLAVVPVKYARGGAELVTTGKVEPNPNRFVTVSARVGGRVVRVGLTRGDQVEAGHVVTVIDSAEIAQAQAELRTARSGQAQADASARRAVSLVASAQAEVERARAEAAQARGRVQTAETTLARQQKLAAQGAFASPTVEAARKEVNAAEGELSAARIVLIPLEAQAQRLATGVQEGVVARKEAEAATSAADQARTRVNTAERQLDVARAALTREESIQSQGLRNAREVQQSEGELSAVRAALRAAEAVVASEGKRLASVRSGVAEAEAERAKAGTAITAARDRLRLLGATEGGGSQITVTTPIGGAVETRPANAGEMVQAGQPLASILNAEVVWVESDVFEKNLSAIKVGQRVSIAADAVPGKTFEGRISYIGGEVNPETRAVRVRTVVNNPGEMLKPNMFARVLIGAGKGESLLVPQEAVQEDGAEQVVFVQEGDGYRRKVVRIGATMGDMAVIASGLKAGDKVVTRGAYQLLAMAKRG